MSDIERAEDALEKYEDEIGLFGYYPVSDPTRNLLELVQESAPCYIEEHEFQGEATYVLSKEKLTPVQFSRWVALNRAVMDAEEDEESE